MNRTGLLLVVACLGLCTGAAWADSLTASVDRDTVHVGESLSLTLELNTSSGNESISPPEFPKIEGLAILMAGSSQSISIVNGQMSVSRSFQYGIIPQKEGTFTIPAVGVQTGGQTVTSSPLKFRAVRSGAPGSVRRPHPGQDQQGDDTDADSQGGTSAPEGLFLRAEVDKTTVYQGEPLVYRSRLFSQYPLANGTGLKQEAAFPGFVAETINVDRQVRNATEKGVRYQVADILRHVLVPSRSGTLTITPETMQAALVVRKRRRGHPFGSMFDDDFDQFFGRGVTTRFVTADPIQIKVLPVPDQGRPSDYCDFVGTDFVVSGALASRGGATIKDSDVLTLKITIQGRGDVRRVQEPRLAGLTDFKAYPPKRTPKIQVSEEGIAGTVAYEVVLAPTKSGSLVVPGVSMSYFDTVTKKFVTRRTEAQAVTVVPGEKEQTLTSAGLNPRTEVQVEGHDIETIKPVPSELVRPSNYTTRATFWGAVALAPCLVLGLVGLDWRRRQLEGDGPQARSRRALGRATSELKRWEQATAGADGRALFGALEGVLLGYLADKLDSSAAGVVVASMAQQLTARGVPADLVTALQTLLERCEQMRFAPALAAGRIDDDLRAARDLMNRLEAVL